LPGAVESGTSSWYQAPVHIPDGFLSPAVAASTFAVAAGSLALALRAERREAVPMPAGVVGAVAAFVFAAQMVNVPVAAGTSGHLVGSMLATVLLGPWRALIAMAAVLLVQAAFFQDGGITALGANFISMGLCGCLVGYVAGRIVARAGTRSVVAAAVAGAFVATLCSAVLVACWLAASGLYPLRGIVVALLAAHVPIGMLEAALTGAVLVPVLRWRPDAAIGLDAGATRRGGAALALGAGIAAVAVVVALAPFASELPDGFTRVTQGIGFVEGTHSLWSSPLADYEVAGLPTGSLSSIVAGLAGVAAVAVTAWGFARVRGRQSSAAPSK
jgi:cobalt/nickel transport system permease protein